jgi:hypothetical protein
MTFLHHASHLNSQLTYPQLINLRLVRDDAPVTNENGGVRKLRVVLDVESVER